MLKIFLISVGFCIFIPFQIEACALAFFDSLSVPVKKALREVGIHTIEDISLFSERELRHILPVRNRQNGMEEIKTIFSNRGESLARDFLVDDVGLSIEAANAFNRIGIHTVGDLYKLTERDLKSILPRGNKGIGVKRINAYFFSRRNYLVHGSVAGKGRDS